MQPAAILTWIAKSAHHDMVGGGLVADATFEALRAAAAGFDCHMEWTARTGMAEGRIVWCPELGVTSVPSSRLRCAG